MELHGRRRVRSGWPGSHKLPEAAPPACVKSGRVHWLDEHVRSLQGYCSFLDLQTGECESQLSTLADGPLTYAQAVADLWYSEADFASASCEDESNDGILDDVQILEAIRDQTTRQSPQSTTFGSRRPSYEDLKSHDEAWVARTPIAASPPRATSPVTSPSEAALPSTADNASPLRAVLATAPPIAPAYSDAAVESLSNALVERLAELLVSTGSDDNTPTSVMETQQAIGLLARATNEELNQAERMARLFATKTRSSSGRSSSDPRRRHSACF